MVAAKPAVVIGLLGTTLDQGQNSKRWERWRPTVALCQQEDFVVSRLELLHYRRFQSLADVVIADIRHASPETEVRSHQITSDEPWDLEAVYSELHDFAKGYDFRPDREDYFIHITTGTHIAQICMFLLTESRYFPARLLQTSPPSKRDSKGGPGTIAIIDLDLSKYDRIASRFAREQEEGVSFLKSGIATQSAAFNELIARIEAVAIRSEDPILLMGPTGSGKSQLARKIFELKKARRQVDGDFVEVNCATIRGDGAMSTLFGHVKGAFTGALAERAGMLKKADGGLLFLDEIGELGLDEQAMLLHAIEEKTFYPVGSDREAKSKFQLIAGTNRDLAAAVVDVPASFREDLYARINLWTFRLPGLAERVEDITPNLDYELETLGRAMKLRLTMSKEARDRFVAFATSASAPWPGNFRDFNAAIRRMATLADAGRIGVEDVEEEIGRLRASWTAASTTSGSLVERFMGAKAKSLDTFDRVQLEEVLRTCVSTPTLSEAGRRLFSFSRDLKKSSNDADRLRKYLARFELDWASLQAR